ncbi:hypothetical protein DICVIV_13916 [Dictyocaulus viviparus]|uniref:Uncharacterized protein n=1 Tax=Dictyocaulus viviparus TaxID=29172 RepID=A0A0D8X6I2_DICVI|nr:hypothetical protein DICVIV_13916 [Dictyocaulus viviparus]
MSLGNLSRPLDYPFPKYFTTTSRMDKNQAGKYRIVIKRRCNIVIVAGFLQYSRRLYIRRIYWMFGFTEEYLSILLKQPVKLELAFVESEADLAYNYI